MGVGSDDAFTGADQALFRKEGMLNAHLTYVVVVGQVEAAGKGAALLTLGSSLDVFVGGEVIHDHGDLGGVEDGGEARLFKLVDGDRGGDVVSQHHVELGTDQLPGLDLREAGVGG